MSSHIVGVDIGSASVRAVEMKNADKAKPVVVSYHEVPLPEGAARRGEVMEVGTVATALRRLWAAGGFKTKDVILGIGGPRVLSRDLSMPKAPLNRIKEALPFHVQEMLPVPVADALLDFYPLSEENGESGPVVHGLLVAAIKEAVSSNVAAATQAGLRPVQVDLIPFALSRALSPIRSSNGVVAVVSIGANTTNVVITQNGIPQFVRIIPAGGDDVTRALSTGLPVPLQQAEGIKRQVGLGVAGVRPEQRPAVEIIYAATGELLTSIRNTLTYYVNSKPGTVLSRIVLSGGASQLSGMARALGDLTSVPVVQAEPLGGVQLSGRANAPSTREQQEAMGTAFGLALGTTV